MVDLSNNKEAKVSNNEKVIKKTSNNNLKKINIKANISELSNINNDSNINGNINNGLNKLKNENTEKTKLIKSKPTLRYNKVLLKEK